MNHAQTPPRLIPFAVAGALATAACSTNLNTPDGAADAGTGADAQTRADAAALEPSGVEITPLGSLDLEVGDTAELSAQLVTAIGDVVPADGQPSWTSSDEEIATVTDGVVEAIGAGSFTVSVALDGFTEEREGQVIDLSACCDVGADLGVDNFCNIPPGTAECPMTLEGGACDPNGDGLYDELDDDDWAVEYEHYQASCGDGGGECTIDSVPNVAEPCGDIYEDGTRVWRCVTLTTDFPGTQASQVCSDPFGAGPHWYTYNLTPGDCCACDGLEVSSSVIPNDCVCVGNGCF